MQVFVGFAVLAALMLWAVIYARGPWALKLVLIVSVPAYGVFVWQTVEQWRGYPVPHTPPDSALIASVVREPDWIYVWLVPPSASEPRAYRIPYTRQAHEQLHRAELAMRAGLRVGFRQNRGRWESYELPLALPAKE